jgi:hypothetical protein
MKKHTSGPWAFRPWKVEHGHAVEFVIDSEDWKQIAMVWAQDEPGADEVLGSGEANARLMAMAPELLRVLEKLMLNPRRLLSLDREMTRTVIARARGQR